MPADIESLVATFEMNIETLKNGKTKAEAEVRKNYIDPLFEVLGWNVRNAGLHEYEKEVVAEYPVKGELGTKKADYCFRLNGKNMFYVEAKDPYVNIEANQKAAFQIRSYCWSAKVPLGVLTDFEEFAIYDGGHEPRITDSTKTARINYFHYKEYKDKWKEIAALFSRQAVADGSLEKYIRKAKRKKGIPVDETFLKDMEHWREILAVNLALRNPELSRREINFAVQRTIDRIVFLRICEDRGTEAYGRIQRLVMKKNIYAGLVHLFREADAKYNSGIFCFAKEKGRTEGVDTLTPNLKLDDSVLKTVVERLYYPSPYNFAVMPADILGQIYERFLGKVIEISQERKVSVEEKPEVRKAGGVYYTPTYIVNYIVENTIDKLIDGKTPAQVAKMRFLDPACGSGSFLIQAYQHLLDWHLAWYSQNDREKHLKGKRPVLVKDRKGSVRLGIDTRKQILLNNVYGVDIDFQAVEVTKLSLLLKVLEGEDDLTMQQIGIFKERALPDLGKNIKCGNSLIGPDYYENVQMNLNDEDEILRVNVFDWNAEFGEIMENGGFDAVIGNPPWISLSGKFGNNILTDQELSYLINKFKGNTYMPNILLLWGRLNTFGLFIGRILNSVLANNGFISFIIA
ncbi:MAG: DNA methyltransferase [Desulfobacterales bacterium]